MSSADCSSGARMDISWAEQHLTAAIPTSSQRLNRVQQNLSAGIDLKRRIIEELRPTLLDNVGFLAALRWQMKETCARAGITCTEYFPDEEPKLNSDAAIALFRIAQEAFANITKHSGAKTMDVTLDIDDDMLVFRITDDGKGITSANSPRAARTCSPPCAIAFARSAAHSTCQASPAGGLLDVRIPASRALRPLPRRNRRSDSPVSARIRANTAGPPCRSRASQQRCSRPRRRARTATRCARSCRTNVSPIGSSNITPAPCVRSASRRRSRFGLRGARGSQGRRAFPADTRPETISGIESPCARSAGRAELFPAAWQAHERLDGVAGGQSHRGSSVSPSIPLHARSQDQLHIHIECLRRRCFRDARTAGGRNHLDILVAVTLGGASYWVRRISGAISTRTTLSSCLPHDPPERRSRHGRLHAGGGRQHRPRVTGS